MEENFLEFFFSINYQDETGTQLLTCLEVLRFFHENPHTFGDINFFVWCLGMDKRLLNKSLKSLVQAEILEENKLDQKIYYSLTENETKKALLDKLMVIYNSDNGRYKILSDFAAYFIKFAL